MSSYPQIIECSGFKLRPHSEEDMDEVIRAGYDPELFRGIGSAIPDVPIEEYASIWLRLKRDPAYSWAIEIDEKCVGSVVQRETVFLDGKWDSDLWMSILESES